VFVNYKNTFCCRKPGAGSPGCSRQSIFAKRPENQTDCPIRKPDNIILDGPYDTFGVGIAFWVGPEWGGDRVGVVFLN